MEKDFRFDFYLYGESEFHYLINSIVKRLSSVNQNYMGVPY